MYVHAYTFCKACTSYPVSAADLALLQEPATSGIAASCSLQRRCQLVTAELQPQAVRLAVYAACSITGAGSSFNKSIQPHEALLPAVAT
jgi:hypothetical protein